MKECEQHLHRYSLSLASPCDLSFSFQREPRNCASDLQVCTCIPGGVVRVDLCLRRNHRLLCRVDEWDAREREGETSICPSAVQPPDLCHSGYCKLFSSAGDSQDGKRLFS